MSGGPLLAPRGDAYQYELEPGKTFTDAFNVLLVQGDQPARIISVESLQKGSSLVFLGARIAGPKRKEGEQEVLPGFPPVSGAAFGPLAPPAGYVVKPQQSTDGRGYELLMGYRMSGTTLTIRQGIRIRYEVAGQKYQVDFESAMVGCPASRWHNGNSSWCVDQVHFTS